MLPEIDQSRLDPRAEARFKTLQQAVRTSFYLNDIYFTIVYLLFIVLLIRSNSYILSAFLLLYFRQSPLIFILSPFVADYLPSLIPFLFSLRQISISIYLSLPLLLYLSTSFSHHFRATIISLLLFFHPISCLSPIILR